MGFFLSLFFLPLLVFGAGALVLLVIGLAFKLILLPLKLAWGIFVGLAGLLFLVLALPVILPVLLAVLSTGLTLVLLVLGLLLAPLGLLFWWI